MAVPWLHLGHRVKPTAAVSTCADALATLNTLAPLAKFQSLNQSGTSALGKANQASQQILALLQQRGPLSLGSDPIQLSG